VSSFAFIGLNIPGEIFFPILFNAKYCLERKEEFVMIFLQGIYDHSLFFLLLNVRAGFYTFFFSVPQQPNSDLGRLNIEVSKSHTIRQNHKLSLRLLLSSNLLVAESDTCTITNTTYESPYLLQESNPRSQQ